jgi:putative transcriptional regulator
MLFWAMAKDDLTIEGTSFLEGKLLIALPGMSDPRFAKTVIFMCAHSADGAMGIVINQPIEGLGFREMARKLELAVTADTPDFPVLCGGPVETGRGFVLHSGDYSSDQSTLIVSNDASLTATLDILRAMVDGSGPRHSIFALGYSSWGAGQIENEIRMNGWLHCDADEKILFDTAIDGKWNAALRKLGIDSSGLSAHAGRA